ncbi:MAG: small multi-drug export protein [Clostridiales bacterium]|jgi:uncharacterized membrane protein|nr:small multi-drug export protein [Clostridiales bacterium]
MKEVANQIANAILSLVNGNVPFAIFLVACVPILEMKGALPFGRLLGFGLWPTFWMAILGQLLLGVLLLFLWKPVIFIGKKWIVTRWFFNRLEYLFSLKFDNNSVGRQDIQLKDTANELNADYFCKADQLYISATQKNSVRKFFIVFLLCAVPIPMTGVWTATAVAVLMKTKFWIALLAIFFSTILGGLIILVLTLILGDYLDLLLMSMLFIALLALIVFCIKLFKNQKQRNI